jgi:hypothetical protein
LRLFHCAGLAGLSPVPFDCNARALAPGAGDCIEITGLALDGRRVRLPERVIERIRLLTRRQPYDDGRLRARLQGYRGLRNMLK